MGYWGVFPTFTTREKCNIWYYAKPFDALDNYCKFEGKGVLHYWLVHEDGGGVRQPSLDEPYINIDGQSVMLKDVEGGADWTPSFLDYDLINPSEANHLFRQLQYGGAAGTGKYTMEWTFPLGMPFKTSCQIGSSPFQIFHANYIFAHHIMIEGDDLTVSAI